MDNKNIESNGDLIILAREVLQNYGINPEVISVIQGGNIKTVWKFRTQDRWMCLKRLKQSLDKALFSVNAQIYIREKGGNVPAVIKDSRNQPIVQYNDQLFVVYEWLQGADLNLNNSLDLQSALKGLAKFHIASKGYKTVEDARISTKLNKWPEQYNSMKEKFINWKEIARKQSSISYHETYLKYVDSMVDISEKALQLLEKSEYNNLVSENSVTPVLCHQDFGKGNAILTDKGVCVIDLDGVTFDLPSRDLRKIIGKSAENKGLWNIDAINSVINLYSNVNPMSNTEKEVLFIDLLFPHWFYGLVKNLYLNNKPLKSSEIEKISKLEQSKVQILNALIKRGE